MTTQLEQRPREADLTAAGRFGGQPPLTDPPAQQLSWMRITVMLLILAACAFGAWKIFLNKPSSAGVVRNATAVYAPYVDATLTPTYPFQSPTATPVSKVYLGFIVSASKARCTPSWGGYYTLGQANQTLNLDSRVAQLRSQGGSIAVSFGGQLNTELAVSCGNVKSLTSAYASTISRYHAQTIDFDIEGAALNDHAADIRRAQAVAAIQKTDPNLQVWMTLPVSSNGLTSQGVEAVKAMLNQHVKLAGINAMAMDFGPGQGARHHLLGTIEKSLYATHSQVEALWAGAGYSMNSLAAWQRTGVTVMIGVNDVVSQHFTTKDAYKLRTFVNKQGILRLSLWSLNRDSQCGGAFPSTGVQSNTCSGVLQSSLEFTKIFSQLPGTRTAEAGTAPSAVVGATNLTDNPATSPYPIWRSSAGYVSGYKVVWQHNVYQAQFWTEGTAPGSTTAGAAPWLLIGPVPAGSKAYKPLILASARGDIPAWSAHIAYRQGDRVTFDGRPYVARWYSKATQPTDLLPADATSPWTPLFKAPGEPTDDGAGS